MGLRWPLLAYIGLREPMLALQWPFMSLRWPSLAFVGLHEPTLAFIGRCWALAVMLDVVVLGPCVSSGSGGGGGVE